MRIKPVLLLVSLICLIMFAARVAKASNVQATAWTWGWGCSLDTQTQVGSTMASASANCVDTLGSGAQSSSYTLVTRDSKTALDATMTTDLVSSSSNWDNTYAGATDSWSESVVALGGTGQGLLWLNYEITGGSSDLWPDEVCLTTTDLRFCLGGQPPWVLPPDIIPFTFGQPFTLAATLETYVVADGSNFESAYANLELGPPSYSFTDLNGYGLPGASLDLTPEPVTLILLGTGLLALGARVARR